MTSYILFKKIGEVKKRISALNVVINKIIHRVFAVVRNQKFSDNNLIFNKRTYQVLKS